MNFDMSTLTPEEMAELHELTMPKPQEETPDKLEEYCRAVEFLLDQVEAMQSQIDAIRGAVVQEFDGLYGGIKSLHDGEQRKRGVGDLKSKYGDMFGDFDKYKEFTDDKDMDLFDKLYDMRGEAAKDKTDFDEPGFMADVAKKIAARIDELKADGTIPQDAEVKVDIEQGPTGGGVDDELKKNVEKYRSSRAAKAMGI